MADQASTSSSRFSLEGEEFIFTSSAVSDVLGLQCGVCHEPYDLDVRPPKTLPCNHTFCLTCLNKLPVTQEEVHINRSKSWKNVVCCPECRATMIEEKRNSLPNDHRIIRGIEAIAHAKERYRNTCFKHDCKLLEEFCKTCDLPLCNDCSDDHCNAYNGHNIVPLAEGLNAKESEFDALENDYATYLRKINTRASALTNIKKHLDEDAEMEKKYIQTSFEEYSNLLKTREEALLKQFEKKMNKRKSEIDQEEVRVRKCMRLLRSHSDDFRAARESKDVRKIFRAKGDLLQQEKQFMDIVTKDENSLCETYTFEKNNEGVFITKLSQIGEVKNKFDLTLQRPPPPSGTVCPTQPCPPTSNSSSVFALAQTI